MSLVESARNWFGGVKAAKTERQVADMLSDKSGVSEDKFPSRVDGSAFIPGVSYFGIRLSGLHMVDARRFATQQLPLCVCLAEFEHAGLRRTIPFSIGPDVIRQKLRAAGIKDEDQARPAWIELRDLTVVRPTPVNEANLSLYAGLFSVPGNDLVKTLLNVVGTVGSALGQPMAGAGVKVAETVYNSFGSLLALNEVNQVAAALIGNVLTESGSGYLLIADVDANTFDPRRGRVVAGRLHWPLDVNGGKPVVEFDHALLALEQYDTIIQKETGLAPALFETLWTGARNAPREQSAAALTKLIDSIAGSPDVTENDRIALIGGYSVTFERLAKARWGASTGEDASRQTRGEALPNLADRLTVAAAVLADNESSANDQAAIQEIAGAISRQATAWAEGDGDNPSDTAIDAAALEAARAVRTALLKHGSVSPSNARGISKIVNRAAAGL